jgi:hypothetical protein
MSSTKPMVAFRDVMLIAHELLDDFEPLHSSFQLDQFIVLSNGVTAYGCYKQALREIASRVAILNDHKTPVECLKQKETQSSANNCWRNFDFEQSHKNALWNELMYLIERAVSLKQEIGCLTPIRRAQLERELWIHRAKKAVAVDYLAQGRLTHSTVELIWAIPVEDRQEILQCVADSSRQSELINWFLSHDGLNRLNETTAIWGENEKELL